MPGLALPSGLSAAGPIGVLDSGVGGLSIVRALRQELPGEALVYVADQAHLPYGPRPLSELRAFVHAITDFLLARDAKTIVVACNAASAAALLYLREKFPRVPFVGMEPAVKPASQSTRSGIVGVLTTAATAGGPLYARVVDRYANDIDVRTIVCPELVQAVENGAATLDDLRPLFTRELAPVLAQGADQIVLGCTHFPFATEAIQAFAGPHVTIIDPSPAVARQTRRVLGQHNLLNSTARPAPPAYYTTGDPTRFATLAATLLDERSPAPTSRLIWGADGKLAADS
jgi:glutamate racemase